MRHHFNAAFGLRGAAAAVGHGHDNRVDRTGEATSKRSRCPEFERIGRPKQGCPLGFGFKAQVSRPLRDAPLHRRMGALGGKPPPPGLTDMNLVQAYGRQENARVAGAIGQAAKQQRQQCGEICPAVADYRAVAPCS